MPPQGRSTRCGGPWPCDRSCSWVDSPLTAAPEAAGLYPQAEQIEKVVRTSLGSDVLYLACQRPAFSIVWRDEREYVSSIGGMAAPRWATTMYVSPRDQGHPLYRKDPVRNERLPSGFVLLRPPEVAIDYSPVAEAVLPYDRRPGECILDSSRAADVYGMPHLGVPLVHYCRMHDPEHFCPQAVVAESLLWLASRFPESSPALGGFLELSFRALTGRFGSSMDIRGLSDGEMMELIQRTPGAMTVVENCDKDNAEQSALLLCAYLRAGISPIVFAEDPSGETHEGQPHVVRVVGYRPLASGLEFIYNCQYKGPLQIAPAVELLTKGLWLPSNISIFVVPRGSCGRLSDRLRSESIAAGDALDRISLERDGGDWEWRLAQQAAS